jgi:hypothetical protein
MSGELGTSLSQHEQVWHDNFRSTYSNLPQPLIMLSEAVNGVMEEALTQAICWRDYGEKIGVRNAQACLLFGAYHSWIQSMVLVSAGQLDAGLVCLRRCVEITCYSAKIGCNIQRANLWYDQRTDNKARRRFASNFAIPLMYTTDKYRHLRPLIVMWDMASYYGAHGNIEALSTKLVDESDAGLRFSFQDSRGEPNDIEQTLSFMCMAGYLVILAFSESLPYKDKKIWNKNLAMLSDLVKHQRIWLAKVDYQGVLPQSLWVDLVNQVLPTLNGTFETIVNEAKGGNVERFNKVGTRKEDSGYKASS